MRSYSKQFKRYMPTEEEIREQRDKQLSYEPMVSIVVPAYETPETYLRELLEIGRAHV